MPTKKNTKRKPSARRAFGEPAERMIREYKRLDDAWDLDNAKSFSIEAPGRVAHALAALAKQERRSIEDQIVIMLRESLENEHGIDLNEYGRPRDSNALEDD